MAAPYTSRAPVRLAAVGAVAATAAVIGAVAGVAAYALGLVPYLAALAPLSVGVGAGLGLRAAIARARLSRPRLAVLAAAVAVAAATATQLSLDYARHRHRALAIAAQRRDFEALGTGMTPAMEAEYDRARARLSFVTYLRNRYGLSRDIDPDVGPADVGLAGSLGAYGPIAVTGIEIAIGFGLAALLAVDRAREPACPRCGRWRAATDLGRAAHGVAEEVVGLLEQGHTQGAAALLRLPDTREQVAFAHLACPAGHDLEAGVLRVRERRIDRRRRLVWSGPRDLDVGAGELAAIRDALAACRRAGEENEG